MDFEQQHPTLAAWLDTFLHDEIEAGIITIRPKQDDDKRALVINHLQHWAIELKATISFEYEDSFKSDKEKIH